VQLDVDPRTPLIGRTKTPKKVRKIKIPKIIVHRPTKTAMFWKVTLMRSGIGLPKRRNDTLVALGLRKRFRTVYKPVNPQTAGLLLRVKELVKVDLVRDDEIMTKEELRETRKSEKGYVVEGLGTGYAAPS
jgi:ribosomal protein L30